MNEKFDIKLVAIDIDDTLLNDEKKIPPLNIEAIKMLKEKGVTVILSSGRPLAKVTVELYKELGLYEKNNYYVAYNGESIYDIYTKECLFSNSLDKNDIKILESHFNNLGVDVARYVHLDENVTVINSNEYSYIEYLYNLKDYVIDDYNNINDLKAHKYQLASDPIKIKQIYDSISSELKEKYSVVISMPCFIEFMKKGVDKYQGILKVSNMLGISENKIMAIGDSMNDLSMIEGAEISVAMGNSNSKIKQTAKFVTKTNNEAGVGEIIKKVIK